MRFDNETYRLSGGGGFSTVVLVLGLLGIAGAVAGYFVDQAQFFHSWLSASVYWVSIALGGLFFVMLHHLVGAKWSVIFRRLSENFAATLPFMALCFLVILFGLHTLYHWSHADVVAADELLQGKSGYLNTTFFIIRLVGYFLIWIFLANMLKKSSLHQDTDPGESLLKRMRVISAPGMILFAMTITFASFDWMMSLDAHWYSTIYGVYVFAGSFLSMVALLTLFVAVLKSKGVMEKFVTTEHFHDLGKLMFAFVIFWGYMAFSQYFLIWYGNIPEETVWFLHRWEGSWQTFTMILVFGQFVIPFFLLFPQTPKKNPVWMATLSIWLLVAHWVDIYWLVMPSLHHHGVHLSWQDLSCFVGIGGIFLYLFWQAIRRHPLVPKGDPGLQASIESRSS